MIEEGRLISSRFLQKTSMQADDIEKQTSGSERLSLDDVENEDAAFANEWSKGLVSVEDDLATPALTIRAIFLGSLWAVVLASANTYASFRDNPFTLPTNLASILSFPMGIFFAAALPDISILGARLNPGPFSVKEHVLTYIIAGAAGGQPYGINNVVGQKLLYDDQSVTLWNGLAWVFATQMVGYGLAGLMRRFLVKPTAMLWPTALSSVAFFNAFHNPAGLDDPNGKYFHSMSRYSAFWFAFVAMFIYSWIPTYFAPVLSAVAVLCLIPGVGRTTSFLGSASRFNGPGIMAMTFDWTQINNAGAVYNPWYTTVNFMVGGVFWAWIIGPLWHFTSAFGMPHLQGVFNYGGGVIPPGPASWDNKTLIANALPMYNINQLFDIHGYKLSVARGKAWPKLLDMSNNLNIAAYEKAGSKIFISAAFSLTYFCSFLSLGAVFSQVYLWYGKDIYRQFKDALNQSDSDLYSTDPHYKIMKQYKDIPEWVYLVFFVVFSIFSILVCHLTPFVMQWWLTIICIAVGVIFTLPVGIIQAITGYQPGLNVITELLAGLIVPGQTVPVMAFKSLGYDIGIQALALTADLKFGYYMHISPISMVIAQMIGTVLGSFFNTFVAFLLMWAHPKPEDWKTPYNFNGYATFANAGGIWGAIGPARFFGPSSPYFFLNVGYGIGFVLPFIPWILNKIFPHSNWRKINVVLLTAAYINMPTGSNQIYIVTPILAAWYVQYYLYNYKREFWDKYAWIVAVSFDSAAGLVALAPPILSTFNIDNPIGPLSPSPDAFGGAVDYYCYGINYLGLNPAEVALAAAATASA